MHVTTDDRGLFVSAAHGARGNAASAGLCTTHVLVGCDDGPRFVRNGGSLLLTDILGARYDAIARDLQWLGERALPEGDDLAATVGGGRHSVTLSTSAHAGQCR